MSTSKSVIINCAGIGSRLGLGLTKALIKIEGQSLISWQLKLLKDIDDIRVVVGYQAKEVVREVLKFRDDCIFVYNHNYFETKTGASFYLGAKDANEYVIEWDGDLLIHPDDISLCINNNSEYVGYSDIRSEEAVFVRVNEKGDVQSFSRKSGQYEWTGPACIKREKLKYIKGNVFSQIKPYLPMKGLYVRAQDIDTYDDYIKAMEFVKSWKI